MGGDITSEEAQLFLMVNPGGSGDSRPPPPLELKIEGLHPDLGVSQLCSGVSLRFANISLMLQSYMIAIYDSLAVSASHCRWLGMPASRLVWLIMAWCPRLPVSYYCGSPFLLPWRPLPSSRSNCASFSTTTSNPLKTTLPNRKRIRAPYSVSTVALLQTTVSLHSSLSCRHSSLGRRRPTRRETRHDLRPGRRCMLERCRPWTTFFQECPGV